MIAHGVNTGRVPDLTAAPPEPIEVDARTVFEAMATQQRLPDGTIVPWRP